MATKRKHKRASSIPQSFLSQAAQQALVRYGPELTGLSALKTEAEARARQKIDAARAGSRGIQQAVDASLPQLERLYDDAGLRQAGIAGTLASHDLVGLQGRGAETIRAGAANEAAGFGSAMAAAKTQATTQLVGRKAQAAEGANFQANSAVDELTSALLKIGDRRQAIRREKGAFESATVGDLVGDQRKAQRTARENRRDRQAAATKQDDQQNFTASENAANRTSAEGIAEANRKAADARAEKSDKKKEKKSSFSPDARRSAARSIRSAVDVLSTKYQLPKDKTSTQAAPIILRDHEGVKDAFLAKVATERYVYGGVSAETNRLLRSRYGITVKQRRTPGVKINRRVPSSGPATDGRRSMQ